MSDSNDDDVSTEEEHEHDPYECDNEFPCEACCSAGTCNAISTFMPTPAAYGADWLAEPCPYCHRCASPQVVKNFGPDRVEPPGLTEDIVIGYDPVAEEVSMGQAKRTSSPDDGSEAKRHHMGASFSDLCV